MLLRVLRALRVIFDDWEKKRVSRASFKIERSRELLLFYGRYMPRISPVAPKFPFFLPDAKNTRNARNTRNSVEIIMFF